MTAESTAIDPGKSPLPDADHDVVRIAEALRRSPHIRTVDDASPGDEGVWFRDASGVGYALSLITVEPILVDEPPGEAYAPVALSTSRDSSC
ncbi:MULTISPECIES: hypothetical protein [unclassified Streptomyces]|uniref:hypothetical protein n=1 Tax=unclassified Streptomyces TaxID=2593676 RepID=UPI0033F7FE05